MLKKINQKIKEDLHLKELLSGASISFFLKIIGLGFGYIFTFLITRNYGAEVMGIYALSLVLLQFMVIFGKLGMDMAALRFMAEYFSKNKKEIAIDIYKKIIKIIIPLSFLISLIIFYISPYIAIYIFHKKYMTAYFKIIAICLVPFVLLSVNSECLRGLKKIKEYVILQNVGIPFLSSIILGLSLFIIKNTFMPIVVYVTSVYIMAFLSLLFWFRRLHQAGYDTNTEFFHDIMSVDGNQNIKNTISNPSSYKNILSISSPMFISGSLNTILGYIDIIILGIYKTSSEVGIYSIVIKITSIIILSFSSINAVVAPKFAEFWGKGDKKKLLTIARQSTRIIFFSSLPVVLVIMFFPYYILGIFGSEFKTGALALIMIAFGQFVNAISGSVELILQMTGFQIFVQNVFIASFTINVLLNFILVPRYGINGSAFASMVTLIFLNLVMSIKVRNILGGLVAYGI